MSALELCMREMWPSTKRPTNFTCFNSTIVSGRRQRSSLVGHDLFSGSLWHKSLIPESAPMHLHSLHRLCGVFHVPRSFGKILGCYISDIPVTEGWAIAGYKPGSCGIFSLLIPLPLALWSGWVGGIKRSHQSLVEDIAMNDSVQRNIGRKSLESDRARSNLLRTKLRIWYSCSFFLARSCSNSLSCMQYVMFDFFNNTYLEFGPDWGLMCFYHWDCKGCGGGSWG